jgi:hypothetical protein
MAAALLVLQVLAAASNADPFAFFRPTVVLSSDERRQLDRGRPIVRVLPARDREVAIFAAVPIDVDGDRLVAWIRKIEQLKESAYVLAIGRFSATPRIEDLASLILDDEEMSEIRACRPGTCGLKLSASEMATLRQIASAAGDDWKPALQDAFRRVVLERVEAYLAGGLVATPPYEKRGQGWAAASFASLLQHSPSLTERLPRFAEHLDRHPQGAMPEVESFVYWSKERLAGKPTINVTHVNVLRCRDAGLPDALVASKGVFSTHYVDASLALTAVLPGSPGASNYLAYLNRSEVDVIHGVFGGLLRWFMQRRLAGEATDVLQGLRERLEGGEPTP